MGLSEEIHVCPVAEAASAAVPYTALADMKDKQKISVWPRSSFNPTTKGSTLPPADAQIAPSLAPAPARKVAQAAFFGENTAERA